MTKVFPALAANRVREPSKTAKIFAPDGGGGKIPNTKNVDYTKDNFLII
jgi:hypothetical protein